MFLSLFEILRPRYAKYIGTSVYMYLCMSNILARKIDAVTSLLSAAGKLSMTKKGLV